jgi:hypothetical protein
MNGLWIGVIWLRLGTNGVAAVYLLGLGSVEYRNESLDSITGGEFFC